jgi:DGQHR domain-containing protein
MENTEVRYLERPFIHITQNDKSIYLTSLKAKDLTDISYVSIRGIDNESGAVQRMLNPKRIEGIKDFFINDGDMPSNIIINWASRNEIIFDGNTMKIPDVTASAQLIDGQHRVAGLKAAIEEDAAIGNTDIPVAIYINLTTQDCANIFLSINTEQKPVPRSLVYDLYQLAGDALIDPVINRARDIVDFLNDEPSSPYFQQIKKPGTPRRKGGIALSTAVSSIKPLVDKQGDFEMLKITEFENQKHIILNFFTVIANAYGSIWLDSKNVFLYASGFTGAIEFLRSKILFYCDNSGKNFTKENISSVMNFESYSLLFQEDVKGLQGKAAPKVILESLNLIYDANSNSTPVRT